MTCSASSSSSAAALLAAALLASACAARRPVEPPGAPADTPRVALLPLLNLSGAPVDLTVARDALAADLAGAGVTLVPPEEVEAFLARHRIRYTGGLAGPEAALLGVALGAAAFVAGSVDEVSVVGVPRAAMTLRLVSAASPPAILWMDGRAVAGDESPGPFGLGRVTEPAVLEGRVRAALAGSLADHLRRDRPPAPCPTSRGQAPRIRYRARLSSAARAPVVAVLPFRDESGRRDAGEIVALQLVRRLAQQGGVRVVDPGAVRAELLRNRVVMEGGATFEAARVALATLEVDVVVGGQVFAFGDAVEFSALAIQTIDNRTVWTSSSTARLSDGWLPFELDRVHTTSGLACGMVRSLADQLAQTWAPGSAP